MRQKKVVISTVVLLVLTTGCVKPTNEPNQSNQSTRAEATVYNEQPVTEVVYADNTTPVYTEQATNTNDNVYVEDATVISTNAYEQQPTTTAPVATTPVATGPYDDPYANGTNTSNSSGGYVDPYATNGGNSTPNYGNTNNNTYSNNSTYTDNTSYSNTNTNSNTSSYSHGSSIHLQVAALKDYYSAEEFKNTLSLPPKYSAYIKRGAMNKVIIKGFSSRAEAKALAARQFPGAFIVAGSSSSGGSSSSYGGGSSSSYTPPSSSYTPSPARGNSNSGIGVQIGAFSSQSKAREAAQNAAAGRYTAIVKTVTVRGRTLYKAILLGFNSRQEAKSAIASGQFGAGFVVTNIYP